MRLRLAPIAILVPLAAPANASTYTFTTLNAPGAAYDINDAGQVVLVRPFYYSDLHDSTSLVPPASYVLDTTSGALTTIAYPGSTDTEARTINNIGVVGGYFSAPSTYDSNVFVRDPATGVFTVLQSSLTATLSGLNDSGLAVGSYYYTSHSQGFLLDTRTGNLVRTLGFNPIGINDAGVVVGGPIFDPGTGTSTVLQYPDASYTSTTTTAINDTGQVVGHAFRQSPDITVGYESISFVYDLSSRTYTTITDPDGTNTVANGINDAGQIVGSYDDASGTLRAFLATPNPVATVPEPASLALLGVAIAGLTTRRKRG